MPANTPKPNRPARLKFEGRSYALDPDDLNPSERLLLVMRSEVDINNSDQNGFVQDWLSAWARAHTVYGSNDWSAAAIVKSAELRKTPYARGANALITDAETFESVIEQIQETWSAE